MASRNEKLVIGAAATIGLIFLLAGSKTAPGASIKVPAASEDQPPFTPPPIGSERPVVGPAQHVGGYVYTPHRYPPSCGSDITALIHHGLSTAALPAEDDMLWLSAPPSIEEL